MEPWTIAHILRHFEQDVGTIIMTYSSKDSRDFQDVLYIYVHTGLLCSHLTKLLNFIVLFLAIHVSVTIFKGIACCVSDNSIMLMVY